MPYKNELQKKAAQKRADDKRAGTRARAWTAVVYPDSAASGWRDILADAMVEALVSPLHALDKEPTGAPKKPHYHIVISFSNPASYDKAKGIFNQLNAVVPPLEQARVKDFRQMARYLCHLDQPNKARYQISDVQVFGGLDYQELVMSSADEDAMLDEIEEFIERNHVISFTAFQRYVRHYKPEWRYVVRHKASYYIRETIKANAWQMLNCDLVARYQDDIENWR